MRLNWRKKKRMNQQKKNKREAYFNTQRTMGYVIIGTRGSGKSALLSKIGEKYVREDHLVFDSFGASDYENCFWVVKGKRTYPCIFILPEYVNFEIPTNYQKRIEIRRDTEHLKRIFADAISEKKIVVFVNSAYEDNHMLQVLSRFYNDLVPVNMKLDVDIMTLIRECSHLAPSSINLYENSVLTKSALIKLLSICRHHRISYTMDMQLFKTLFRSVRSLSDRIIVKRSTPDMLPDELKWFTNRIKEKHERFRGTRYYPQVLKNYPRVHKLFHNESYLIRNDALTFSKYRTKLPSFHHKREKENFFKLTGIKMTVDEDLKAKYVEKKKKTSDEGDSKTDKKYLEERATTIKNLEKRGMLKTEISEVLGYKHPAAITMFKKRHKELF